MFSFLESNVAGAGRVVASRTESHNCQTGKKGSSGNGTNDDTGNLRGTEALSVPHYIDGVGRAEGVEVGATTRKVLFIFVGVEGLFFGFVGITTAPTTSLRDDERHFGRPGRNFRNILGD